MDFADDGGAGLGLDAIEERFGDAGGFPRALLCYFKSAPFYGGLVCHVRHKGVLLHGS